MRSGSLALLLVGLSLIPCVSLSSLAFTGDVVLLTKLKTPTHHLCRGKQISSQHRRGLIIPAVSAAPSALRTPGKASPFCISAHGDSSGGEPVEVGDVVRLHYLGDLEDGDEFDSTFERDPIEFEVGSGRVIRGIDAAVIGMRVGELKDVMVPCEEAFGLRRESRLLNISKANLPPGPYPGQLLGIKGVPGVVTHVWDGLPIVEVDANHPLAGEDLYVTLKLVGLVKGRELTSATFAGGPFWGLELVFQRVPGVLSTQSGYTQGHKPYPTYSEVQTGRTGHTEAVLVTYDSRVCSYHNLLEAYFSSVDVTTIDKQRSNYGPMYRCVPLPAPCSFGFTSPLRLNLGAHHHCLCAHRLAESPITY